MFQPTHWLVSHSTKTPVQLVPAATGYRLMSKQEFEKGREPAFELRPRLGVFCHSVQVVGYVLEPMPLPMSSSTALPSDHQTI